MTTNAPPSIDPADEDSVVGMMRTILRKFLQGVDDMLPARVIAFNGDRNNPRVTVQAMVAVLTTDKRTIARPQIASVPVLQMGAGGHLLSFNIRPGDMGWIHANDRDISMFLQTFNSGPPNTERFHSFEDAVFIPDAMRGYTIDPSDADAVVLQTLDGTVKVSVGLDAMKFVAPGCSITMASGVIAFAADASISMVAPVIAQVGALTQDGGGATMTGPLTVTGEVTAGGIPLTSHKHTGVAPGGGNSGEPIP